LSRLLKKARTHVYSFRVAMLREGSLSLLES
jgi:hypothetical protein